MDRQTTLAFILIGAILMIWLYINTPEPPKTPPKKDTTTQPVDSVETKKDAQETKPASGTASQTRISEDTSGTARLFPRFNTAESIVTIETENSIIEVSNKGGKIVKYYLKKYKNWYASKLPADAPVYEKSIQLLNTLKGSSFDIAFMTVDGKIVSTALLEFQGDVNKPYIKLGENDSLILNYTFKVGSKGYIKKSFVFYGNRYDTKFGVELINLEKLINNNSYDIVWDAGIRTVEQNSVDESTYSNASLFYGGEQVIIDAPGSGERIDKEFTGRVDWVTIRNKYFAAIMVPDNPSVVEGAFIRGYSKRYENNGQKEFYSARIKMPFNNSPEVKAGFMVYIGPVGYDVLKGYEKNLETIVDFGSFFGLKFVVRPIAEYVFLPLFNFLNSFIPNYGVVIIIFSIIIKILLHPLTRSSYQSMRKMQLLQPMMAEVKEKYKDDPTRMNKEVMKLYSTYGINPMGGCLPLILQMPVFIALWGLFQTAIELRQQPFIWWITDLSQPDVIFHLPFKLPLFGLDQISGLALLMGITTFIQQKQSIKDPQQQMLVYIMPVMLTILFMSFPSGLNLYYFLFNVFSIAQQYYMTHSTKGVVLEPVKNTKKGKGFLERMMEAAEKKAKEQQANLKKRR